jgi:hypothetical protein
VADTPPPPLPVGRQCVCGRLACHSWLCYEEEYGESREDLMGGDEDFEEEEEE